MAVTRKRERDGLGEKLVICTSKFPASMKRQIKAIMD
jgi:hypothetical protein